MNAIAVTFNNGDIGVMSEAVKESSDGSSVWKDLIPFLERSIGSDDNGAAFISSIDDFVKKIGGIVVV